MKLISVVFYNIDTYFIFIYNLIGDRMKKTILDYSYNGKKVIMRCDFNVPIENGIITDDTRILASLKSINYLINNGAKVILLSHLGKVKTLHDKEINNLYPVYKRLKELLSVNVYFSEYTRGIELENMISDLNNGEVLLIQNTRYEDYPDKLESGCDDVLSRYWASLGDIFINDAYGTSHRAHASNVGISKYLPNGVGFLVQEEILKLDSIMNDQARPFIVIMGGKKISDKTLVIDNLITKCDKILIGGGMCFTFLKALGINVGESIVDDDNISYCKNILDKYSDKIILPIDIVLNDGNVVDINMIPNDKIGFDIGPKTIKLFTDELSLAKKVIINGPMGVFEEERFSFGTKAIYDTLVLNNVKTLVGGGDSAASVNLLGFSDKFYHVSTGGGATLEYLSGKVLPGIDVINEKNEK